MPLTPVPGSCKNAGFEAVAELGQAGDGSVFERVHGQLGGLGEADNAGDVLGAGAAAALVAAANQQRLERRSAADEERAGALGAVHLVGADGEQMAADAADIDFDFARALHRVDVEEIARWVVAHTQNHYLPFRERSL